MRTDQALGLLTSLQPSSTVVASTCGTKGDAAYLQMTVGPRWAVVSSPGDRWFSLEVDGGFAIDHFEEDTPEGEIHEILSNYVELALAYLREPTTPRPSGRFGLPVVEIVNDHNRAVLRRSLWKSLRSPWRRHDDW